MKKNKRAENKERLLKAIDQMDAFSQKGKILSSEEVGSQMGNLIMDEIKKIVKENELNRKK